MRDPGDQEELAHWTHTPSQSVRIDACASNVSLSRPLLPSHTATATRAGTAWAVEPEYVVGFVGPDGSRSSIRRTLPPVAATREHAVRDFETRSIELPDGAFLGTLPEDFPFPATFQGPDTFLRVETDSLGAASIVGYRIVR